MNDKIRIQSPPPANLPEAVYRAANERPTSTALIDSGNARYTYADMVAAAKQVAAALHACSSEGLLEPETRIGICMERRADQVVAMLGIAHAGAACVLLDPSYPAERLRFMFEDSACQVVIVDPSTRPLLPPSAASIDITELLATSNAESTTTNGKQGEEDRSAEPTRESLAMVIYTSGSSGQPKAAMLTHGNLLALLGAKEPLQHGPGDVVAQVLSPAFDAIVLDVWGSLSRGATVFLPSLECARSVGALLDELDDTVTTLPLTSSMWHQLVQLRPERLTRLRAVWFGGEAVSATSLRPFVNTNLGLVHHYGPTECTSIATVREITPADVTLERIPIGRPVPGVDIYLLNEDFQAIDGEGVGEIFIGGEQVGRGYLGRPAETAAAFLPDPFSKKPGARMYRTGDYACRLADGSLEFRGRKDDQVKIRGYRLELGEVTAKLRACPGVSDAAVALNEAKTSLTAYVVAPDADEAVIRNELGRELPEYMLPREIHFVRHLPLLPNGKVAMKLLEASLPLPGEVVEEATEYSSLSQTQRALADIWQELLDVTPTSPDDDFFAMGGYSLMMAQLTAKVEENLSIRVPLRDMFRAQTLTEQADLIDQLRPTEPTKVPDPPTAVPRVPSPDQARLWFLHQWNPDSVAYSMPMAFRLRGKLRVAALESALQEVFERNEVLRWSFVDDDGVPVVRVRRAEEMNAGLDCVDLNESDLNDALQAFARLPFDLEKDPLFRVRLFRIGDDYVFAFVTHHIVFDGWSIQLFTDQLAALYHSYATTGAGGVLPPPKLQYADLVARQLAAAEESRPLQRTYWTDTLRDAPQALKLPTPLGLSSGKRLRITGQALGDSLLKGANAAKVTPFAFGAAAYALSLRALLGAQDVILACPTTCRSTLSSGSVIGFLVKTLPIRLKLRPKQTLREIVEEARDVSRGAFAHQDLSFNEIARCASGAEPASLAKLVFNMVDLRLPPIALEGVEVTALDLVLDEPRVPLATVVSETDAGHRVEVWYDSEQVAENFAEKLSVAFQQAVELMDECSNITVEEAVGKLG